MTPFGIVEWYFLAFMLLLLPYAALKSRTRMRRAGDAPDSAPGAAPGKALPPLTRILGGTLVTLLLTGLLAWYTARGWDFAWWEWPGQLDARRVGYGAI